MNCRPGDLCFIVRVSAPLDFLNDKIVKLAQLPPLMVGGEALWRLDPPLEFSMPSSLLDARNCRVILAGDPCVLGEVQDINLRPIRGGLDEVRSIIREAAEA